MKGKYNNILDLIGQTPVVPIISLNPNKNVEILAKLEFYNPGGSVKDRPALYMIEDAEKKGALTKDKIILEATSGNTGIGLALVAAVKGYRILLTMSEAVSEERVRVLRALGADIKFTSARLSTDGAIEYVYNLIREEPDKYWLADQRKKIIYFILILTAFILALLSKELAVIFPFLMIFFEYCMKNRGKYTRGVNRKHFFYLPLFVLAAFWFFIKNKESLQIKSDD